MNKYDVEYAAHNINQFLKETFFVNKTNGYFVDIVAHDGIAGSNSHYPRPSKIKKDYTEFGITKNLLYIVVNIYKNNF